MDKPRLLDQMRDALRARHYGHSTEHAYVLWVRRFIYFHQMQHPGEMGQPEINAFLTHLALQENVSASTQNQALAALLFLYRHVLPRETVNVEGVIRARRSLTVPVVMTRGEVEAVLA
jgi:site-specific recombinase XerD